MGQGIGRRHLLRRNSWLTVTGTPPPGFLYVLHLKELDFSVSLLFATLTAESTSVAAKGVRQEGRWLESNFTRPDDFEGVRGTAWRAPMIEGHERTVPEFKLAS